MFDSAIEFGQHVGDQLPNLASNIVTQRCDSRATPDQDIGERAAPAAWTQPRPVITEECALVWRVVQYFQEERGDSLSSNPVSSSTGGHVREQRASRLQNDRQASMTALCLRPDAAGFRRAAKTVDGHAFVRPSRKSAIRSLALVRGPATNARILPSISSTHPPCFAASSVLAYAANTSAFVIS